MTVDCIKVSVFPVIFAGRQEAPALTSLPNLTLQINKPRILKCTMMKLCSLNIILCSFQRKEKDMKVIYILYLRFYIICIQCILLVKKMLTTAGSCHGVLVGLYLAQASSLVKHSTYHDH